MQLLQVALRDDEYWETGVTVLAHDDDLDLFF